MANDTIVCCCPICKKAVNIDIFNRHIVGTDVKFTAIRSCTGICDYSECDEMKIPLSDFKKYPHHYDEEWNEFK